MQAVATKNKMTGRSESIKQIELTKTDWGFRFFVESELDAFKAAYEYRNSPNGVKVEYAAGVQMWAVTVFNEFAKNAKIDGAK